MFKKSKNKSQEKSKKIKNVRYFEKRLFLYLFIFSLCLGIFSGYAYYKMTNLDDIKILSDYSLYEVPTAIYDVNGEKITEFYHHKRTIISYNGISKPMINTLLQAEDKTFFEHKGIDFLGIFRALIKNVFSGRVKQGGSTITQQLAKLMFTDRERSISRKFKELWLSFQIEKRYTKKEILEKYFNKVYYGNNLYGLYSAARFYFGKKPVELNYAESAFLVAIPPAPSYLNPLRYPLRTKARQEWILHKVVLSGLISKKEAAEQVKNLWFDFQRRLVSGELYKSRYKHIDKAPYFSEYIRRILVRRYSEEIYTGGYRVYTTLDLKKQSLAKKLLKEQLDKQKEIYKKQAKTLYDKVRREFSSGNPGQPRLVEFLGYAFQQGSMYFYRGELSNKAYNALMKEDVLALIPAFASFGADGLSAMFSKKVTKKEEFELDYVPEGALVSLEAKTGRILAMVGGSGYTPFNQLNRATQARRQPGSAFKPFVYLTALHSRKFTAASVINDRPLAYQVRDGIWIPGNASRNYKGRIRLREALKSSVNIVSVRLIDGLTAAPVIYMASKILGLNPERFREDFSLALGTSEVTPLELAKGYAVLANLGREVFPYAIVRVEDKFGRVIWSPEKEILKKERKQLVAPEYVYVLIDMMKDVITRGTASKARSMTNFNYKNAAGKTGTSSNLRDAWFSGFTPNVVTTVWVGFDKGITLGSGQYGGDVAAPVWMKFMKEVLKDYPRSSFPFPGGITQLAIHPSSGLLMPKKCFDELGKDNIIREYFVVGTEPKEYAKSCEDDLHVTEDEEKKINILGEKEEN